MGVHGRPCATASATSNPTKSDREGLYLTVMLLEGSKLWRLAYRFAGKQKTFALGPYPAVTPARAREATLEAKRLLSQGVDPSEKA